LAEKGGQDVKTGGISERAVLVSGKEDKGDFNFKSWAKKLRGKKNLEKIRTRVQVGHGKRCTKVFGKALRGEKRMGHGKKSGKKGVASIAKGG